jgi:hypothetical protein
VGHIRLGELPRSRKWDQVIDLIGAGGDVASIAAATFRAAEVGFEQAAKDEGLGRAAWLLTQLPLAARQPNYSERLAALGLKVSDAPDLPELIGSFSDAIDSHMRRTGGRTDFGEMAQLAAAETLASVLGSRTQTLFGSTPEDVRVELGTLATARRFADLARRFIASLTRRYLSFFLSRELPNHVGGRRRFANASEHAEFDKAFDLHCLQASLIVEDFAGGWFSKTNWERGITPADARSFIWVALKKVRSELRRGARLQR